MIDGRVGSYTDPRLKQGGRRYARFVRDLDRRGLVEYGRWVREEVGLFFVWKKDRHKMRMILDCRRSNARFVAPPHVSLVTAEGLGNLEVDAGEAETLAAESMELDGVALSVGIADVKDAFHRLLMPSWMRRYFGLQPLTADEAGIVGKEVDGVALR